jgi:hypothetical protein
MRSLVLLLSTTLVACSASSGPEDWQDWYDPGAAYEVEEPVEFTDADYGLPVDDAPGIGDLLEDAFSFPRGYGTNLAAEEFPEDGMACADWYASDDLPFEITGVVTVHPRFYFKTNGCGQDDEKYYGSYFLEDDTGGVFVLGDSKVAHFDMGDTVTLRVRGTRRSFGLDMIYVHEVVEVQRTHRAISYEVADAPFGADDMGEVRRITGTIVRGADNFGEVLLAPDGHNTPCTEANLAGCALLGLDVELSRRGISFEVGERVTATGPILYSYSAYSLVLSRVGQIERLQP